jgi:carbon-monoxide dehydrogenase medium subunit
MLTYLRADGLEHALEVLAAADDDLKVLAGGQSLIPMMNLRLARPDRLLDIGRLDELSGARIDHDTVRIGALVSHRDLERSGPELARAVPLLAEAAPHIGHAAIRERGTFGGSLAHGDPAAEWPACALALDATLVARSARGERRLPADGFFVGPLTTVLEPDELLVAVELPAASSGTGAAVEELAYRHGDYAVVGIAAQVVARASGEVDDARIALFGVDATPVRARAAEAILRADGMAVLDAAAAAAAAACDPSSDVTASAEYRRRMVAVFTRRALERAWERAVGVPAGGAPAANAVAAA